MLELEEELAELDESGPVLVPRSLVDVSSFVEAPALVTMSLEDAVDPVELVGSDVAVLPVGLKQLAASTASARSPPIRLMLGL